ncbi:hypothetical protein CDD80_4196 [Ophiocordyceps camponoti-rufipedis]|uniref:Uncharacterized protein n=1 Tax=Ophiocordyceps camponoti-rufipedis TaxID=2004952 RepID=A0A2C5XHT2_9HYPO|nr:hypothetical protein CDD80_4196 [Ophiocordyceps camponoti-rufipedis]
MVSCGPVAQFPVRRRLVQGKSQKKLERAHASLSTAPGLAVANEDTDGHSQARRASPTRSRAQASLVAY